MSEPRKETLADGVEIWLGDCREVLPLIGRVDAVVTDPPYGIGVDRAMAKQSGTQYGRAAAAKREYQSTGWDDAPPSRDLLDLVIGAGAHVVIWGGNYFELPPARCWLIWDKENGDNAFADCEMAWTNLDKPVRRISWMWNGMLRKGQEARTAHPTQKPLGVMEWCLGQIPANARTILDPFMGSGTTGVACAKLDRAFIGIEREPSYFDIARRRLESELAKPRLPLDEPAPRPVQYTMLDGDAA